MAHLPLPDPNQSVGEPPNAKPGSLQRLCRQRLALRAGGLPGSLPQRCNHGQFKPRRKALKIAENILVTFGSRFAAPPH
jgi:hypothetical protein